MGRERREAETMTAATSKCGRKGDARKTKNCRSGNKRPSFFADRHSRAAHQPLSLSRSPSLACSRERVLPSRACVRRQMRWTTQTERQRKASFQDSHTHKREGEERGHLMHGRRGVELTLGRQIDIQASIMDPTLATEATADAAAHLLLSSAVRERRRQVTAGERQRKDGT